MRRLLRAWQDRGRAAVELHDRGARVEVADLGVDDVALAVGVLGVDLLPLGLTQRLLDDLLRGLRADASERRGGLFERDRVPRNILQCGGASRMLGHSPLGAGVRLGVLRLGAHRRHRFALMFLFCHEVQCTRPSYSFTAVSCR